MTTRQESCKMRLTPLPEDFTPRNVASINAKAFIVSDGCDEFIYNIDTNTFDKCIGGFPYHTKHKIAFDQKHQILYLYGPDGIKSLNIKTYAQNAISSPVGTVGVDCMRKYFLFINNTFHIINNHHSHWVGCMQNNSLNTLHNTIQNTNISLLDGQSIYIPSKQCILLIGGVYSQTYEPSNDIWMYKLKTKKWVKIDNISFQARNFGAVLTSNQKYVILILKQTDILVLDMNDNNDWKIKQCQLKMPISKSSNNNFQNIDFQQIKGAGAPYNCPFCENVLFTVWPDWKQHWYQLHDMKYFQDAARIISDGEYVVARTGGIDSKNDILVVGCIKEYFKLQEFKTLQLPPMYIVGIIAKWYSAEMIHVIARGVHYSVYLRDILLSLY